MKTQKYRTYTFKLSETTYKLLNQHLEAGRNKNQTLAYFCKICGKSTKKAEMFLRNLPKAKHRFRIPVSAKVQAIFDETIKKYGFEQHPEYLLQFLCTTKKLNENESTNE